MEKSIKWLENEVKYGDAQIAYLKEHDPLTGVAYLSAIREQIETIISQHPESKMAVLSMDIDHFKLINQTMGSQIGDLILQKMAQRIHLHCTTIDVLARKGGDEFLVVLQNINWNEAIPRIKDLLKTLTKPFFIDNQPIYITTSIGISLYPDDAQSAEELLMYSDCALAHVKKMGKNNYCFFTKKMGKRFHDEHMLQNDLHMALKRQELFLHYQPKINVFKQNLINVEALLRWKHSHLGVISPDRFIPSAEKNGLIVPISDWVLHQACRQSQYWKETYHRSIAVSVNISARQFQSFQVLRHPLIKSIRSALNKAQLSPELLELEITESMLMKDDLSTRKLLKKIKDLGVLLSCDDFGVGYSSFSQLKKLPLDTLKIDKSLIKDILKNPIDVTIVRAIVSIARQLNIKVVAEGVETDSQFILLKDLGCDWVQGNYFAKAMDADSLESKYMKS